MSHRVGEEIDDYCTRCHRLTDHTIAAMVDESIATTACRTCGFQHPWRGGKEPVRGGKPKATAFDQVLAGILGGEPTPEPKPKPRTRKKP